MKRLVYPAITYLALAATYLMFSNAPVRVHALSLLVLFLALLVPALAASFVQSRSRRLAVCSAFALMALLLWDASAQMVIVKAAAFSILLGAPYLYLGGLLVLTLLSYTVAWLAAPPDTSCADSPSRARD